jgi:hypothetical protein
MLRQYCHACGYQKGKGEMIEVNLEARRNRNNHIIIVSLMQCKDCHTYWREVYDCGRCMDVQEYAYYPNDLWEGIK